MPTAIRFEWDPRKSETNRRKHGIDFEDAKQVFSDPLRKTKSKEMNMEKSGGERSARSKGYSSSLSPTRSMKRPSKKRKSKSSASSRREKLVVVNVKNLKELPELTAEQRRRLEALRDLPDDQIDFSDIPEMEFKGPVYVGLIPGPGRKTSVTIRLDSDMVEWFKAQGKGWQTKMNWALRLYFATHRKTGAIVGRP